MMNGVTVNDDDCTYSIAGGNYKIVHILEQSNLKFAQCLLVAVFYNRNELCDWLMTHYECEAVSPEQCLE